MGTIAAQLDVSEGTMYRWFGTREQLVERVLDQLAHEFFAITKAQARGTGDERVLDHVRRFMEATLAIKPIRTLVEREPRLALRVLLGEQGVLRHTLKQSLAEVIAEPAHRQELRHSRATSTFSSRCSANRTQLALVRVRRGATHRSCDRDHASDTRCAGERRVAPQGHRGTASG